MLLLSNARTITVDGITVFPDHADLNQFWYLPAPVSLSRRGADQSAQFTLILYKPAAVTAGARGGGFLMFETGLRVDKSTEQKILSRLSSISKKPRLTAVQFDEGKVQCIALNLQGGGGTGAGNAPEGSFNAVEKILGASVPSLHGDNSAAFSLQLSQEGATILREAFRKEGAPVGVLYNLKFTGIRPALEVKITADMKRVYDHFSASLSGQVYFVQLGIEAGIEKLKQSGALKVEVIHFTSDADRSEKERQAIQLFRDTLLKDFFTPTLTPGQLMGGGGGTAPGGGGTAPGGGGTAPGGGGTAPGGGGTAPGGGGTAPGGGGTAPGGGGTAPGGGGTAPGGGGTAPGGVGSGGGSVAATSEPLLARSAASTRPQDVPVPAPGDATPGGGDATPGGGDTAPGGGGTAPGGGGTAPGGGGTTPGGGGTAPGGGGTAPGGGGTAPGGGGTAPGGGGTAPGGGGTTPGGGGTAPGGGGTTPGGGGTAPGGGGTAPGGGGTAPGGGGTAPGGGGTAPPTTGGSPISISFKLKFIKQEELRQASYSYSSQEAVQREYNPQGFIGLLTKDLDQAKHFIEVDLDDPFFRQMAVTVDAPIDFAKIGLHSAQVALDYGNPADPSNHRHKDIVFDKDHRGEQKWEFFLNTKFETQFISVVQYHFDPGSSWEGEKFSYQIQAEKGEDRTLYINPFERFRFLEYMVTPRGIDFGVVDFTEVLLRFQAPSGWKKEKTLSLLPNATEPQVWRLRTPAEVIPTIFYKCRHHLKDGTTLESQELSTTQTAILVDDPFPGALELTFFPFLDSASVRKAIVDVEYKDKESKYERKERLEIPGAATDEVRLRIAIMNPAKRKFKYKVTLVKAAGVKQLPPVETEETLLSISEG